MQRRHFIKILFFVLIPFKLFPATILKVFTDVKSNFKIIYLDFTLKSEFFKFLENVFNLYPEQDFHKLISDVSEKYNSDKEIYVEIQSKLGTITPLFSAFQYQLPALKKQKKEMTSQTVNLLGDKSSYNGFLEIGSSGRYLDPLEEELKISGQRYYADFKEPTYAVTEMIDRGQLSVGAKFIPMANYQTDFKGTISNESLDLVTVYIGFHHCPIDLRFSFVSSIRDTMRTGAKLILRDHDCNSENQKTLVALAHDVFNLGTHETWEYNSNELRNFYSLDFIIDFVEKVGFKFENRILFQNGDPTKNALMLFTKI